MGLVTAKEVAKAINAENTLAEILTNQKKLIHQHGKPY
jgi:hypothetical protein